MTTSQIMLKEITYKIPSKDIAMQRFAGSALISDIEEEVAFNVFKSIPKRHKRQKIINRGTYEGSRLSRVYQLDMMDNVIRNIPRAGVVFYAFINDELHLCFGRDKKTGDLTDFGGSRNERKCESSIKCAIREGNEESRFAFSKLNTEQVQGFCCLYSSNMLIVFIPVVSPDSNIDIREITQNNFNDSRFLNSHQRRDRRYNEISEIVWLNETQIDNIFSEAPNIQMYAKVRRFIYSCDQLSKNMKYVLKNVIAPPEEILTIQTIYPFY